MIMLNQAPCCVLRSWLSALRARFVLYNHTTLYTLSYDSVIGMGDLAEANVKGSIQRFQVCKYSMYAHKEVEDHTIIEYKWTSPGVISSLMRLFNEWGCASSRGKSNVQFVGNHASIEGSSFTFCCTSSTRWHAWSSSSWSQVASHRKGNKPG